MLILKHHQRLDDAVVYLCKDFAIGGRGNELTDTHALYAAGLLKHLAGKKREVTISAMICLGELLDGKNILSDWNVGNPVERVAA